MNCLATPTRADCHEVDDRARVDYHSQGALLIIGDGQVDLALVVAEGLPGPAVLIVPREVQRSSAPAGVDIRWIRGKVTGLEGWLGQFKPKFVDVMDSDLQRATGSREPRFDLVIDLSQQPLLTRSVLPFGYFAPRSPEQLAQALAQCQQLVGRFSKPKYFNYEPGLCAHSSFGQSGCTRCLDVCGAQAIRSAGEQIEVNPHLCQGCASCTLACPTGALSFAAPTRQSLLSRLEKALASANRANPVVLVHSSSLQPSAIDADVRLSVEALAAFGEELWFAALALGARQLLLWVDEGMPGETRQLLDRRIEVAQTMLSGAGYPVDALRVVDSRTACAPLLAPIPAHRTSAPATEVASLPVHSKRALFTRALAQIEAPEGFVPLRLFGDSAFGTIDVDRERCTLCSACARICPTAAIRYDDGTDSGTARLAFAEELCVQCGACELGCPERAIALQARIAPVSIRGVWRIVAEETLAACLDCGRGFMPHKLLEANIRRSQSGAAPEMMIEQMRRCPDCRHRRIRER